jgi:3-oxoadipate enol-lactonase
MLTAAASFATSQRAGRMAPSVHPQRRMQIPKTDTIVRRRLEVTGRRVSYLTIDGPGTGDILLFIHGAGVSARTWVNQLRNLSRVGTPVAIDLPGRHESDPVPEPTLEAYAESVYALLEILGDRPAFVVGHSLGGAVAQVLTLRHPERVIGLILMSTCAKVPPGDGTQRLLGLVPVPFRRIVFLSAVRKVLLGPSASADAIGLTLDEVGGCPTRTIQHDTAIGRAMDMRAVARALRVPTLILCGARDRLTAPELSLELSTLITDSRLQIVPSAGHMLPLEAPDVVNAAIAEFVAGAGPQPASGGPSAARRVVDRVAAWRPWRAWSRHRG